MDAFQAELIPTALLPPFPVQTFCLIFPQGPKVSETTGRNFTGQTEKENLFY